MGAPKNVGGELSAFHVLTGTTWTELEATYPGVANAIDYANRVQGRNFLIMGILMVAVLLTGFRKGERWAWYTMWVLPLFATLSILQLSSQPAEPTFRSALWVWLFFPLVALPISYRTFFPGKGQEQPDSTSEAGRKS